MLKPRLPYADALSRLLFAKAVKDLTPLERAQFDILRAMEADKADEARYEQLGADLLDESEGKTLH
jgi:hypothetical protein